MAVISSSRPEPSEDYCHALAAGRRFYQVNTYLKLVVLMNPQLLLEESTKIPFGSTFLYGNAANWWYMLVQSEQTPAE